MLYLCNGIINCEKLSSQKTDKKYGFISISGLWSITTAMVILLRGTKSGIYFWVQFC